MIRILVPIFVLASVCHAQTLPSFNWANPYGAGKAGQLAGMGTDALGNSYFASSSSFPDFPVQSAIQNHLAGAANTVVVKVDASGNVVYSTYFGGSGIDTPTAMTVDPAGNVYVTGTTTSTDFPTTPGTYAPSVSSLTQTPNPVIFKTSTFLFKLNPDGTLGYSTYFTSSQTMPSAIAVDSLGSAYITGTTYGGLPVTAGAYQTTFKFPPIPGFFPIGITTYTSDMFLTRFNARGSGLVYSTYLDSGGASGSALAVASDGSAYAAGSGGVYLLDPTGSSVMASAAPLGGAYDGNTGIQAVTLAPKGNLYLTGLPGSKFQATAGAFQTQPRLPSVLPATIIEMDPQLKGVIASTFFGGSHFTSARSVIVDPAGNVYIGGSTSPLDPVTRTPFVRGFGGNTTGYVAELTGDLSTLLFASDFGDEETFGVSALAIGPNGSFVLAGNVNTPGNIWLNSVIAAPPLPLRIDSVTNAASRLSDIITTGETIIMQGAGFAPDSQLTYNGVAVPTLSISPTQIAALGPTYPFVANPGIPTNIQVLSGAAASNPVLVAGSGIVSPGLYSADGSGLGQGYILNQDGTLNTPANPAAPGSKITIFATGVGPVSLSNGQAVTYYAVGLHINGVSCDQVAAIMGPVASLPGDVYQLTVIVPDLSTPTFQPPPQVPITLQVSQYTSQTGLMVSVAP